MTTKSLLIVFILFIKTFCSFSQTNVYFQNNPVWLIESTKRIAYCIDEETTNYYLNGDTTINSFVYKKLFKKGYGNIHPSAPFIPGCWNTYNYEDVIPRYFLRSEAKKMFLLEPSDTSEYLLYDFNLSIGDTLPLSFNNNGTITITAIDSIYTPYGYRKRFALAGDVTYPNYLVEGIGNSRGLLEYFLNSPNAIFDLKCYSLNDSSFYPSMGEDCEFFLGINSINKTTFSVFPNPFTSSTTIVLSDFLNNVEVSIYNMLGEQIRKIICTSGNQINIEREFLPAGLYFFELCYDQGQNKSKLPIGKLIVQD